jgi:hypothetical protein
MAAGVFCFTGAALGIVFFNTGTSFNMIVAIIGSTFMGGVLFIGGRMNEKNLSVTLYEDHIEWRDWRGARHSCPNGEFTIKTEVRGHFPKPILRTLAGKLLVVDQMYNDREVLLEELRRRASSDR